MISLFIDESGQFENQEDKNTVVGGVMVKHESESDLRMISQQLSDLFRDAYGPNYPYSMHGKERNRDAQNRFLQKFNESSRWTPVFIQKGCVTTPVNSNIADDQTACLLYFNMVNQLVSGALLFDPDILKDEEEIQIQVASRVAVETQMSPERKASFQTVGFEEKQGKAGDALYHLNSETSLLIHLNRDIRMLRGTANPLRITIKKVSIQYASRSSNPNMDFFYASDIICNHVYNSLRNKTQWTLNHAKPFIYDDLHEQFRRVSAAFHERDYFVFLIQSSRFNYLFQSHAFYPVYALRLHRMEQLIRESIRKKDMAHLLYRISHEMSQGQYNRQEAVIWLRFMESFREDMDDVEAIQLYDLWLQAHNHSGDYVKGKAAYLQAAEAMGRVRSIEMMDKRVNLMNRFATTSANAFDFIFALETIDQAIEIQEFISDALSEIHAGLLNDSGPVANPVLLGKLYSSKARLLAFQKNPGALDYFRKALSLMGFDRENKRITISSFIHFLADHPETPITPHEHEMIGDYFQNASLENYIEKAQSAEILRIPMPFELFAFLKWHRIFKPAELERAALKRLAKVILRFPSEQLQHPWELICFQLAALLSSNDANLTSELYRKARAICANGASGMTMKIIGGMITLEQYGDASSIASFRELIKSCQIPSLEQYFEMDRLDGLLSNSERCKHIRDKFTFMYH